MAEHWPCCVSQATSALVPSMPCELSSHSSCVCRPPFADMPFSPAGWQVPRRLSPPPVHLPPCSRSLAHCGSLGKSGTGVSAAHSESMWLIDGLLDYGQCAVCMSLAGAETQAEGQLPASALDMLGTAVQPAQPVCMGSGGAPGSLWGGQWGPGNDDWFRNRHVTPARANESPRPHHRS